MMIDGAVAVMVAATMAPAVAVDDAAVAVAVDEDASRRALMRPHRAFA